MRSTEAREQLLKKEWRNKLNLQQYVQQRYEESIQEVPILEGESPIEAKRRQLFYLNMVWFMTTLLDRKRPYEYGCKLRSTRSICGSPTCRICLEYSLEMKMYKNREKVYYVKR